MTIATQMKVGEEKSIKQKDQDWMKDLSKRIDAGCLNWKPSIKGLTNMDSHKSPRKTCLKPSNTTKEKPSAHIKETKGEEILAPHLQALVKESTTCKKPIKWI